MARSEHLRTVHDRLQQKHLRERIEKQERDRETAQGAARDDRSPAGPGHRAKRRSGKAMVECCVHGDSSGCCGYRGIAVVRAFVNATSTAITEST